MKFKIDENLPVELAVDFRDLGYDADTVQDEGLIGSKDSDLMATATSEGRILLTMDKGIANLQEYPAKAHAGVVLFRPSQSGRMAVRAFVRERLAGLLEMSLQGRVIVVGATRIRVR